VQDYIKFQELLDEKYNFPCDYSLKFVVPSVQKSEISSLFSAAKISERQSKTGKYTSFTVTKKVHSSDEVVNSYKSASKIKNLIML
jgi:putative lipoic acid-binding regulatory protein